MEKLQKIQKGSTKIEEVGIDDSKDQYFKPGIYRQTEAFLKKDKYPLCSIEEQIKSLSIYERIAGYKS